jgi:hypothetical protein
MLPGTTQIGHAHLHVWDILASLNAQNISMATNITPF